MVVFQIETERGEGLHEGATTRDALHNTNRDKVQSCKFLEDANRVSGAENGYGARKPDIFRARSGRGQNDGGGGIKELSPVMFADAENIQNHVVRELYLFQ